MTRILTYGGAAALLITLGLVAGCGADAVAALDAMTPQDTGTADTASAETTAPADTAAEQECAVPPEIVFACQRDADCGPNERCTGDVVRHLVPDPADCTRLHADPDAPHAITTWCEPVGEAFVDDDGPRVGGACTAPSQCPSNWCLPDVFEPRSTCTTTCRTSADCVEAGAEGLCVSDPRPLEQMGHTADLSGGRAVWLPTCLALPGEGAPCGPDWACPGGMVCTPNVIDVDPTRPAEVEYLCSPNSGTGDFGDACYFGSDCASGVCGPVANPEAETTCTVLCDPDGPPVCEALGAQCVSDTYTHRLGAYAENTGVFHICGTPLVIE